MEGLLHEDPAVPPEVLRVLKKILHPVLIFITIPRSLPWAKMSVCDESLCCNGDKNHLGKTKWEKKHLSGLGMSQ